MPTLQRATGLAAAIVTVVAVAGCSSNAAEPAATPASTVASTPTAPAPSTPAATGIDAADLPDGYYVVDGGMAAVPERNGTGCEGMPGLEPRPNESPEGIGGYWYSELRDLGPIDFATGEVTLRDDGQPAFYVAAEGDTMYAIAQRFCIDYAGYLGQLNGIRRGDGNADLFELQSLLYAGDTINLDPYTIATVGDQGGQVFQHAIGYRIPEQRP